MRIVTIEDEINAYEYLISLLGKIDTNIEVVAHHDSVKSAVNYFQGEDQYDLIFMDIQIADGLSFEIFNHVEVEKPVIFTTAYDQYAIDAFKFHSIDYLLKPIHLDDLKSSISKYKGLYENSGERLVPDITQMLNKFNRPTKNRCLVKKGGHFEYVNVSDIAYVCSENSITFLFTKEGNRFIYSKTVEQLFMELDQDQFFQINRSQIVNIEAIKEIHPFLNQRLSLKLAIAVPEDRDFIVSRQKLSVFKDWVDR